MLIKGFLLSIYFVYLQFCPLIPDFMGGVCVFVFVVFLCSLN